MVIKKKAGTFDVYVCELSFKELQAIQAAGQNAGDAIADETSKAIQWYFANEVPPPGVDEHPSKVAKEAGASSEEVDSILPLPGGGNEDVDVSVGPGGPDGLDSPLDDPSAGDIGAALTGDDGDGKPTPVEDEDEADSILPKE